MERYCSHHTRCSHRLRRYFGGCGDSCTTHGSSTCACSCSKPASVHRPRVASTPSHPPPSQARGIHTLRSTHHTHPRHRIEPRAWRAGDLGRIPETARLTDRLSYRAHGGDRKRSGTTPIPSGVPRWHTTYFMAPKHWTQTRSGPRWNWHRTLHDPLPPRIHRDFRGGCIPVVLRN